MTRKAGCMDGDEVGASGGAQGAQDAGAESGAQVPQVSVGVGVSRYG